LMFIYCRTYFSKGITHQRARNNYIFSNDHNIEKRLKLVISFNNTYVYITYRAYVRGAIFEKVTIGSTGKDGLLLAGMCRQ
jgi:hypothetical protein